MVATRLWCTADDALLVWDRIVKAGETFALKPAGLRAMDILDLEAGVPRPGRDYRAARDAFAATPTPFELGLESLIDEDHAIFNGRAACLAAPRHANARRHRTGWRNARAAQSPLHARPAASGETMSSLYSPALQRAIALAAVDVSAVRTRHGADCVWQDRARRRPCPSCRSRSNLRMKHAGPEALDRLELLLTELRQPGGAEGKISRRLLSRLQGLPALPRARAGILCRSCGIGWRF